MILFLSTILLVFFFGVIVGGYISICQWQKRIALLKSQVEECDLQYQAAIDEVGRLMNENERLQDAVHDLGMTLAELRARRKPVTDDEPIEAEVFWR